MFSKTLGNGLAKNKRQYCTTEDQQLVLHCLVASESLFGEISDSENNTSFDYNSLNLSGHY